MSDRAPSRIAPTSTKASRLTSRFVRRFWGALLVVVVGLAVLIASVLVPGLRVNDVHLDEAAVFVVKTDASLVGNLNLQSDEMANGALVGATNYEVLQREKTVVVKSTSPNQLASYDPATNQMGSPVNLPPNATVSMGGDVVAVTNPDNGRVWHGSVDTMLKTDFQLAKANMDVGEAGLGVVTTSGQVIGLSLAESVLVRGEQKTPIPMQLDPNANVQLSAVGERAVVLDRTTQRIWFEGSDKVWEVDAGSTAQLAPPSATAAGIDGAQAIYATRAGLIALTKDGPRSLSGLVNENPIAPLIVDDCAYGAFGTQFVKRCAGDDEALITGIPEATSTSQLRFTNNRRAVVINDASNGWIWLVDKDLKLIKDWSRVTPAKDEDDNDAEETQQVVNPDRSKANTPPVAKNDLNLSARVGRSTVLPVLDNDSDADGDILTILGPPQVKGVTLDLIRGGTGLQITLPEGHSDAVEFSYSISDGRGKTATARARVKPLPDDQSVSNQLPLHFRPNEKLVLGQTQRLTKRVLLDWRDPDGDDLILVDADVDGGDDEVTFTSDGQITFQDVGKTTGLKKVLVKVSDGDPSGRVVEGELLVEVVKGRIVAPIANGDHVTTAVDRPVNVDPLANDVGLNLTLREVTVEGGSQDALVQPNFQERTFSFTAKRPGTYYVAYKVANGPVSTGLVRIDVTTGAKENNRPVAARDVVLLPPGGSVLVDPLLNDSDADGDVLVIQSVSEDPHLRVVMEQRRVLTISADQFPTKPLTLTYWISDGSSTTPGTIVVIPVKQVGSQAPKATKDDVRARAGTTVSIPVLENDSSPLGLRLSIDKIVEGPAGRAWIDGDMIRVAVPSGATAAGIALTYQIKDSDGRTDSASVNITVISPDAQNEAPAAPMVEARVLSGTTTRVVIPLNDLDPNGDAVRLLGISSGPHLGRITAVGEHYLSYEAFPNSQGTDSFRYEVVDALGAVGVGEVRVGVAPPVGANTGPTTVPDEIVVRPGRQVTLPLLTNDFDIDGDSFGFVAKDAIDLPFKTSILNGSAITFTAPTKVGATGGKYYVRDSRNGNADGDITIRVATDAPNLPPVAVDDLVNVQEVVGKEYVDVPVLTNDFDPDQASKTLTITLPTDIPTSVATVDDAKQVVRVKVAPHAQQVRYTITDDEGGSATAVATVPGTNDVVPVLKDPKLQMTVTAGERTIIEVNSIVAGTNGRSVTLPSADKVFITNGRMIASPDKMDWTPDIEFSGPAALVFEVRDEVPAGDKTAKRSVISVPVTVKPAPNISPEQRKKSQTLELPPELIGDPPVLVVGAGEEKRIDLAQYYRDPNGQDIRFDNWKQTGSADGVTWRVADGRSMISASAAETAKAGTSIKLVGTVIDAANNTAVAELTINVVGSTRPKVTVVNDVIDDANAGEPRTVSVLANDKSNLLSDTSLHLVSAAPVGAGSAQVNGDQVVVTPPPGYVGEMSVRYTVVDATRDPLRHTDGFIRLTVRAEPGKPGVPIEDEVGDGFVKIHWTDGAANGLPVLKRIVRGSAPNGASVTQECATNTCTITGLTNDRNYTFTVTQTNEIGEATSGTSAVMVPDVVPERMQAPSVEFGDAQLTLKWTAATTRGSAITEYRITNTVTGEKRSETATSLVWTGLTNGTTYQFQIEARNKAGWSTISGQSAPEHPTGAPPTATAVTGVDRGDASGGWIRVNVDLPVLSVDPILTFDLYANGKLVMSDNKAAPGKERQTLDWGDAVNGKGYVFTVVARNRGPKASPTSAASDEVVAYGRPDRPVGARIEPVDGGVRLVSIPDSGAGGGDITKIEVRVEDTDTGKTFPTRVMDVGDIYPGLSNGHAYHAWITLYTDDKASDEGATSKVRPKGDPYAPVWSQRLGTSGSNDVPVSQFTIMHQSDYSYAGVEYNNGNPLSDISLSWSGGGQSGTADHGDLIQIATPGGPIPVTLTSTTSAGVTASSTSTLYSPMWVEYSGRDLVLTLQYWPRSNVSCEVSGGYAELLQNKWVSVSGAQGTQRVTLQAPPADDPKGTPGTGWAISCSAGQTTMQQSGSLP
ncbi:Ig-like domain-containing protein [Aestuariimicrobium ganziense]|uniref:Ig-like domain-containing protein n=1 Tax=Aestuariimicrobium ganziense TaxID=2773677 RepID=UPI0019427A9E|nr:Ig-like domain-containing protein [Aestuariimicrobium ganziense]